MTTLAITLTLTALAWLAVFGFFIFALHARWFARYSGGFFISVLIALVGVALMSASVVGTWGYQAAKRMLDQELVVQLQDVGGMVENEINRDIVYLEDGLSRFGATIVPVLDHPASATDLRDRLRTVQSFDPCFLQLGLFDREGRLLAASTEAGQREEASRVAIAFSLEGKPFVSEVFFSQVHKRQVVYVGLPLRVGTGPVVGIVGAWYDLQTDLSELVGAARFNQSGYAVVVGGDGQIIAHPDRKRLNEDVSWYPAVQQARLAASAGAVTALNARKESRVFGYRRIANPATLARVPWVLLTEINADEQLAPLRRLRRELALGIALVLLGGLIVASQVSRSIQRPLQALGAFAHRIGTGDLTARLSLSGRDVAGRLAKTLNEMAAGLEERDHVKEVFGRYIATQVSDKILSGQVNLGGESRNVTILFSDIRNFTATAEQMTPTQVVTFLNDYFSEMVEAVFEQNGMLDKFLGDGLMAVFGAFGDAPDHPRRAVMAALRMKALLAKINGERSVAGKAPIAIGIGIHSDEVIVGNIGSRKRLEFTVVGDGVNVSSRLQGLNKEFGTTILVSETTFQALEGEFECRQMPEAALRGRAKELKFYEVVSAKAAANV
jgi:class 3 adenylate cyclase